MDEPRRDDHLVEPLFAGLDARPKPTSDPFWRTRRLLWIVLAIGVGIAVKLALD